MTISKLTNEYIPANKSNFRSNSERIYPVKKIVLHHVAGIASIEELGALWQDPNRGASSNYGIGNDAKIGCYVPEEYRAYTSGNDVDEEAITIEISNNIRSAPWSISSEVYSKLCMLIADISQRYNFGILKKGENIVWHNMYENTECPGSYIMQNIDNIINDSQKLIDNIPDPWASEAISWALTNEILQGDGNGNLRLHENITRQESITALYRLYNLIMHDI